MTKLILELHKEVKKLLKKGNDKVHVTFYEDGHYVLSVDYPIIKYYPDPNKEND
jgi:hypothetical protein|tara:strand:- start:238 stop:399 length:162 start_codon:yes stop_codon:yes gene_type:complete